MHCTDVRSIIRKSCARSRSNPPVHRCTLGLGKETTRDLPRDVSAAAYVGVSGDGMQEPPNESDASVSTLVKLCCLLYCLFLEIPF